MVNVIIPAYNCSSTLGRTLGSLVAQTDAEFEVIVVDDCSTEDIKPIVDDYSNKLSIRYIRNEHNLGCGMSRQVGIDNVSSKFFCFLDSDDILMPYTIETFNSIIATNHDIDYVYGYFYKQTTADGRPSLMLYKQGYTWCHGKLYNRDSIDRYGIKNSPEIRWADDSYFNSMCSELFSQYLVPAPLYLWCDNPNSVTRRVDPERDKAMRKDFLLAMKMSTEFILQHKDRVEHLKGTIDNTQHEYADALDAEEQMLLDELRKYIKE